MAGLVPAIHVFEPAARIESIVSYTPATGGDNVDLSLKRRSVDGRDKAGHDDRARCDAPRVNDLILFPNAQSCKNLPKYVFNADPPNNAIHSQSRASKILGYQFWLR